MSAVDMNQSSSSTISYGWRRDEVTDSSVNRMLVQKFTEIVTSYNQRKQGRSLGDLKIGPWYANDYATALKINKQLKRIEWFVNRNAFFHGFPPKGFTQLDSPSTITRKEYFSYRIQPECVPTQALENVNCGQVCFIDCGSAVELAMYETLREIFGDERFNEIFSAAGPNPLKLNPHALKTPLYSLGLIKEATLDTQNMRPNLGDNVYFSNVPLYGPKHPNGESRGYHAVCISPPEVAAKKYIALGISDEGKTEAEMADVFVDEFNKDPIDPLLICAPKLAQSITQDYKAQTDQFRAMTGCPISHYKMDRNGFEQTVVESNHDLAGLHPVVRRFDIPAIQKHLK